MTEELEVLEVPDVQAERVALPSWWTELQRDYRAGMANVFILHGNVADYVDAGRSSLLTLREFLESRLGRRHAVATFAPDQGITLAGGELVGRATKGWIDQVLGVAAPEPASNGFDAAAALRLASGGGFGGGSDEQPLPSDAPGAIDALLRWARGGATEDAQGRPLPNQPVRAIKRRGQPDEIVNATAAVIIERTDLIVPPAEKDRLSPADRALLAGLYRAGADVAINRNKALVIILAPSLEEIHPDLRLSTSGIRTIEVPVPDYDQRLAFVARALADRSVGLEGLSEPELASQTAGLGRRHIEDLAMRAAATNGKRLTPEMVKARKDELIRAEYAEVLTILDPDVSFDEVGGHDLVKAYLQRRVVSLMRDDSKRKRCPMGILFAGPSGTGKTFLSRALAHELGINCVEMSPDNIRGSYVGESEKKLKRAIAGVKAMSPCILFIDEIDTKVRRPSGGGGGGDSVEGNIFGKLLEFLGDTSHRGEILLVCATNRPDSIDAALKRPGRLDAKIPLLPPDSPQERASALAALAKRHHVVDLGEAGWLRIGEETDSYTQAELEGLVVQAASIRETDEDELAEAANGRLEGQLQPTEAELLAEAFTLALEEVVPSTDDIRWHTDLAIAVCSNRRLVPERYRARVGKQLARPAARTAAAPVIGAGRVAVADDDADYDDEEE